MRLLTFFVTRFSWYPAQRTLPAVSEVSDGATVENAVVAFIHVEPVDEDRTGELVTKLSKNLKWAARKNGTRTVVLHSFAHLAAASATGVAAAAPFWPRRSRGPPTPGSRA